LDFDTVCCELFQAEPTLTIHPAKHWLRREAQWLPRARMGLKRIPPPARHWLLDSGSLTDRLRRACEDEVRVRVLNQSWQRPLPSERRALGLGASRWALIRQVLLVCGGVPWVFARTVIPAHSLHGPRRRLARLGERPLGAVLFADRTMRRGVLELAALGPGEPLFELATDGLEARPPGVWGRRSVFRLSGHPLLVCEVFLPALIGAGAPTCGVGAVRG
jgi:chorismate lyase